MTSDVSGLPKYQPDGSLPLRSDQVHAQEDLHTEAYLAENTVKPDKRWNEKAHDFFDRLDQQLEEHIPTNRVQKVLDDFYDKSIDPLLQKGRELNRWIDKNDYGAWYKDLAAFITMLPIRAVRNIAKLAFNIVKGTVYAFVHPLKALTKIGHYFIQFIESLLIPATYTKIGAGIIGAAAGQAIFSFGIPTIVGLSLGGSFIAIGLMAGAIKSGIEAEEGKKGEAIKVELWNQIKAIPECALTGFFMGLMFGGIQKAMQVQKTVYQPPSGVEDPQKFVDQFFKSRGIDVDPSAYTVHYNPQTETISAEFTGSALKESWKTLHSHGMLDSVLSHPHNPNLYHTEQLTFEFHPPDVTSPSNVAQNITAILKTDIGNPYYYGDITLVNMGSSNLITSYPIGTVIEGIPQGSLLPIPSFVASCEVIQNHL